ncbi:MULTISPECIES: GtrA family protein [unclassified Pseudomonas]|jgi:putative flippase GtrA|uniref:GtrA family protein n=1 Tax=Pseudomonas glycinae TaxID=1785145 RepID=A0ABM5ZU66_9PSED|nr:MULTISPECIES: GtrA family protein [unclassified Pseudomonas]AMQ87182.2 GtrA family protein [Pseudomonas glycinae]AWA40730.1 GtrA family protein [Pseudomonas fluorescens]NKF29275.1 GtrA family protein [Pseudomonas sp. BG5]
MSKQKTLTDLIKFVIGGGINTAFTFALYYGLQIVLPYQVAYALAFATGIVFSYWFNATIVFRTPVSWKGFFAFPLVYLAQYLLSAVLLSVFVERLEIPQGVAPLVVIVVTIPVTFVLTRWFLRRT